MNLATDIQAKINEIRILKTDKIDHFQYSKMAKIPFKVHSFIETMNCRMIDFCEATDLLMKNNHIVPSMNLIRSLFENIAITFSEASAIDTSLKSKKIFDNFDDLINKITFGTRYNIEIEAINILTLLLKNPPSEVLNLNYLNIIRIYLYSR